MNQPIFQTPKFGSLTKIWLLLEIVLPRYSGMPQTAWWAVKNTEKLLECVGMPGQTRDQKVQCVPRVGPLGLTLLQRRHPSTPRGAQSLQVTSVQTQVGGTVDLIMYHLQTHPGYAGLRENIWNNSVVCTATTRLGFPEVQQPNNWEVSSWSGRLHIAIQNQ